MKEPEFERAAKNVRWACVNLVNPGMNGEGNVYTHGRTRYNSHLRTMGIATPRKVENHLRTIGFQELNFLNHNGRYIRSPSFLEVLKFGDFFLGLRYTKKHGTSRADNQQHL